MKAACIQSLSQCLGLDHFWHPFLVVAYLPRSFLDVDLMDLLAFVLVCSCSCFYRRVYIMIIWGWNSQIWGPSFHLCSEWSVFWIRSEKSFQLTGMHHMRVTSGLSPRGFNYARVCQNHSHDAASCQLRDAECWYHRSADLGPDFRLCFTHV